MPTFLCLGKRRGTGEGRLPIGLHHDFAMKQRFKIQLTYCMHRFPHRLWHLHDLGMLLGYSVQKRNLEFGVQLKKKNVAWGLFSLHHIYWPAPVTLTLLGDTWSSWPFIWTSEIWTKVSTDTNYLNIAESCMLWPIFVSLQVSTWPPATQILPWEFSMNSQYFPAYEF